MPFLQLFCVEEDQFAAVFFCHDKLGIAPVKIDCQVSGFGSFYANSQTGKSLLPGPVFHEFHQLGNVAFAFVLLVDPEGIDVCGGNPICQRFPVARITVSKSVQCYLTDGIVIVKHQKGCGSSGTVAVQKTAFPADVPGITGILIDFFVPKSFQIF